MNKQSMFSIVRHVLTFGGGYIAAKGYIDQSMANEAVGAIVTLITIGWSVMEKKKAK